MCVLARSKTLLCPNCHHHFSAPCALGQHFKAKAICHEAWVAAALQKPIVTHRQRWRISAKCAVLDDLLRLEQNKVPLAQSVVMVMHPGIGATNISLWNSLRDKLFLARQQGYGHVFSLALVSRVWFPDQEDVVYLAFYIRRMLFGLEADDEWLKTAMDEILMIEKPLKWDKFRNSNGWVIGFKKRFRISSQCLTNKKDIPIFQKLPRVQKFHRWLLLELQQQQPPRCPKYGFFPARYIFHMDQVHVNNNNNSNKLCSVYININSTKLSLFDAH